MSCPPGLQGAKCDQECDIGYYGAGCNATCSDHCRGNQSLCDHVNGTCDLGCDPGYQDSLCTIECASGTWGDNCQNQCNSACTNGTCDHVIGTCDCNPGYWGNLCDHKCNATTYGDGCQTPCSLDCVEQLCDHVTGQCDSCAADRTGLFCQTMTQKKQGGGGTPTATIVGVVVAVVVILVVIAAVFIFWRRRTHKADEKQLAEDGEAQGSEYANFGAGFHQNGSSDQHAKDLISPQSLTPKSNAGFVTDDETGNIYSIILTGNTALSMETLKATILQPSADSHFKDEFSSIPMANNSPQTAGLAEKNIKKNRYKNIIPYDSSRVLLQADHSKGHSDYINASFVKGYKTGESFIASQGPNDLILNDFVRMLWEHKVDKVVMLTNLIELGKKKCNMYWPTEGEEEYDEVTVGLLTTHVFADYTIRHLRLSKSGEPARDVTQFHFTAWPDKSVPESPWGLVDFHQRVMAVPGSGPVLRVIAVPEPVPVLVHCSAGVGRTGTFIALCNLLQEAEDTGKMNFLDTLWKLRQDRMHTIQTAAQYMFLHKAALVGHTLAGSTIQVKDMYERLSALESENGRSFGQEFEAVVAVCAATIQQAKESREEPEESVYNNTGSAGNKSKNRLSNILANEAFRPVLIAEAHNEDTYINAVFVPSLTQSNHDILTQLPLPSTVTDFWRLVTQFNVGLVVAFDVDSGNSDETIGEFLPKSETEPFENDRFLVEARLPSESKLFNKFTLIVHQKLVPGMDHSGAPKVKNLTLLVCKNSHLDPKCIFELQEKIKSCRPSGKSRVVYMSRNGADHCGLMCVQSILLDRLEADQCLTVPLVVGSIKAIRPQVIPTVDEYKCLYQVLKLVHEGQNEYGNMGPTDEESNAVFRECQNNQLHTVRCVLPLGAQCVQGSPTATGIGQFLAT
ncbi:hypothetical protein RRG08_029099 [Elysia crispata]|uniref:protein-tyrosine-phosphatase n=1 Tax=Elysia crispata TaxID=231223 RepID=A0AAE0YSJ4_9GAST|nr:hypothetical protein RRG08_029099 [Elysia crispata]